MRNYCHALLITFITWFSLTHFADKLSIIHFEPIADALHYELSDLFYLTTYDSKAYDRIVLVDLDSIVSRNGIAEVLSQIKSAHPRVVGLDVNFNPPPIRQQDSLLLNILRSMDNLVLPCILHSHSEESYSKGDTEHFWADSLSIANGFINVLENGDGVVRSYTLLLESSSNKIKRDSIFSFPAQVLRKYDHKLFDKELEINGAVVQNINFSLYIDSIRAVDLQSHAAHLRDKIVLVGSLKDDIHKVPAQREMNGTVILANILYTMLENVPISVQNNKVTKYGMLFLCSVFAWICFLLLRYMNNGSGFFIRLIQTGILVIYICIGYHLYQNNVILSDFTLYTLMLGLIAFFADLYWGVLYWGCKLVKRIQQLFSNRNLILLFLFFSTTGVWAQKEYYQVVSIQGKVNYNKKPVIVGDYLVSDNKIEILEASKLTLRDCNTNAIYECGEEKKTSVRIERIIEKKKNDIWNTIRSFLTNAEKPKISISAKQLGVDRASQISNLKLELNIVNRETGKFIQKLRTAPGTIYYFNIQTNFDDLYYHLIRIDLSNNEIKVLFEHPVRIVANHALSLDQLLYEMPENTGYKFYLCAFDEPVSSQECIEILRDKYHKYTGKICGYVSRDLLSAME